MAIVNLALSAIIFKSAIAKAVPSEGSVPAPTSSKRTRVVPGEEAIASSIRLIRRICPLNVDKFCCKDCSSPISAKIFLHHGNLGEPVHGKSKPAFAIKTAKPILFKATVLPPVLGPVIATTFKLAETSKLVGTTLFFFS